MLMHLRSLRSVLIQGDQRATRPATGAVSNEAALRDALRRIAELKRELVQLAGENARLRIQSEAAASRAARSAREREDLQARVDKLAVLLPLGEVSREDVLRERETNRRLEAEVHRLTLANIAKDRL